jgi:pimeloyl-ACP methyl ester carboxylesterase
MSHTPDTIVLIHGLWLTSRSWERWIERYASRGYRVLAPTWPGLEGEVEALNADPTPLARLTANDIVDHYEKVISDLDRPPIIIGHSFGGTFMQMLLDRGLGAAGVGVASATVKGVRDLPLSTIRVAAPALNPLRRRPVRLSEKQFHYAFTNTVSRCESDDLYARYAVPTATTVLREYSSASFRSDAPTQVTFRKPGRAPMLLIGFGDDHLMPPTVVRHNAAKYDLASVTTEYKELPGFGHFPGGSGCEEVADYSLTWAVEHASA